MYYGSTCKKKKCLKTTPETGCCDAIKNLGTINRQRSAVNLGRERTFSQLLHKSWASLRDDKLLILLILVPMQAYCRPYPLKTFP